MKNYLLFKLHWHFFLQKHSSVDEWIGKCSISKGRSWECFSLALGSRYPYKADSSNRLSWISTCSFWPSRRHYWVFHSFQSETASMFNSSSQTIKTLLLSDKYLCLVSRSTSGSKSCHRASLSRCSSSEVKHMDVWKQYVEPFFSFFSPVNFISHLDKRNVSVSVASTNHKNSTSS